jgi:hypothetical protein
MANVNNTRLSCNDLQKFTELLNPDGKWFSELALQSGTYPDKDGIAFIEWRDGLPDKEIKQLSKENPDLIFSAEFSFEDNWYSTIYMVEFKGGEENEIGQKPSYLHCSVGSDAHEYLKGVIGDNYVKLMNKADEIFMRMDTVVKDGKEIVDFIEEEVIITVEEGDYQMKLRKKAYEVEIIDFLKKEIVINHKWVPVVGSTKKVTLKSEIPF